jgi:ribonuclease HI
MLHENALNIYTDGSMYSGPRAGGIGIIFVVINDAGDAQVIKEFERPGYMQSTNQEMELQACIVGLEEALDDEQLSSYSRIEIFTDSQYVSQGCKSAMFVWPKTRWTSRETGRPILHVDQWKQLLKRIFAVAENFYEYVSIRDDAQRRPRQFVIFDNDEVPGVLPTHDVSRLEHGGSGAAAHDVQHAD